MRSIWKGALNCALLSIGVKIYKGTNEGEKSSFHMLHKACNTRMNMKRWCAKCETFLEWDDLVKGYAIDDEHYILFDEKDMEELMGDVVKNIKIDACIESNKIDEIAMGEPYVVIPEKGFGRVYMLLLESLRATNSSLVGTWVNRNKEHCISIKPYGRFLMMIDLKYGEEINNINELPTISQKESPSADEINLGIELLQKLNKKDWKLPTSSGYEVRFAELLNRKSIGEVIGIEKIKAETETKESSPSKLMEMLKKSIEAMPTA